MLLNGLRAAVFASCIARAPSQHGDPPALHSACRHPPDLLEASLECLGRSSGVDPLGAGDVGWPHIDLAVGATPAPSAGAVSRCGPRVEAAVRFCRLALSWRCRRRGPEFPLGNLGPGALPNPGLGLAMAVRRCHHGQSLKPFFKEDGPGHGGIDGSKPGGRAVLPDGARACRTANASGRAPWWKSGPVPRRRLGQDPSALRTEGLSRVVFGRSSL